MHSFLTARLQSHRPLSKVSDFEACARLAPARRCATHPISYTEAPKIFSLSCVWQGLSKAACAAALVAAAMSASPPLALADELPNRISDSTPVLDLARVIPTGNIESLQQQLRTLETETGWRVRVLSRFAQAGSPSIEEIRSGWHVDDKTIVVFVDPSAPNIM